MRSNQQKKAGQNPLLLPQTLLPIPAIPHAIFQGIVGMPTEDGVDFGGVSPGFHHIAGSSRSDYIVELYSTDFFKGMDHFQNGVSISSAHIEDIVEVIFLSVEKSQGLHMRVSQIHHMDVIPNATAVHGIVIISKYGQLSRIPAATCVMKGTRLFGVPMGNSPILALECAPIGLK